MIQVSEREPVITLSAGPVAAYPAVLRAMSRPIHYDFDRYFLEVYARCVEKATKAFGTKEPALVLQCEPAPGLEAASASLIGPEDVVLNLASGVYGKGFGYWAARTAKEVLEIEVPYNEAIPPEAVEAKLKERPDITVVAAVHHDTPSGTINPVDAIGAVTAQHGAMLFVDAVSSFAGMPVSPLSCQADIFVVGPGKCLGGPTGLSVIGVSERAWAHMEANPTAPRASILSLLDWKDAWQQDKLFPFTPSVTDIYGLDAALDLYLAEGAEAVWARHAKTAAACRAGIEAMGLGLWAVSHAVASPTCTAVRVPEGLSDRAILDAARDLYGVVFSSGRNETAGKLIRIGHMGPVAEPIYALVAINALGGALQSLGHTVDHAAGVAAAQSIILS